MSVPKSKNWLSIKMNNYVSRYRSRSRARSRSNSAAIFLYICFYFMSRCQCRPNLHSTFTKYEILTVSSLSVTRVKRSINLRCEAQISVTFTAFQLSFHLSLIPGTDVLHPEARAFLVDGAGRQKSVKIDRNSFYTGTANGNHNDQVDATEIEDGIWILHIHTRHEFYAVEPLQFYDSGASDKEMVVYRGSDIRSDNTTISHTLPSSTREQPKHKAERLFNIKEHKKKHVKRCIQLNSNRQNTFKNLTKKSYSDIWDCAERKNKVEGGKVFNQQQRSTFQHNKRLPRTFSTLLHKTPGLKRPPRHRWGRRARALVPPISKQTECDLLAIADYNLYKGAGKRNQKVVIATLVHVYQNVNRIFRNTVFGDLGQGYGIVISRIMVHTAYTEAGGYNAPDNDAGIHRLYDIVASEIREFLLQYCLVHLSLQRVLKYNYQGYAKGGKIHDRPYGVCGGDPDNAYNFGFTTTLKPNGNFPTLKEYSLTVAHEIGHNWGALHDPRSPGHECDPLPKDGGHYLMWPFTNDAKGRNADKFSPCSRRYITAVLKERVHTCFIADSVFHEKCGNGVVDVSEDCDPGFLAGEDGDSCCSGICRLKPHAECSPWNHPCCTEHCQVAPATQNCYNQVYSRTFEESRCKYPSKCLGNDAFTCSLPLTLPNGTPCGNKGACHEGRCASYCEERGRQMEPPKDLRTCLCDGDRETMCRLCCMDMYDTRLTCKVMGGNMDDTATCLRGRCHRGRCETHETTNTTHNYIFTRSYAVKIPKQTYILILASIATLKLYVFDYVDYLYCFYG